MQERTEGTGREIDPGLTSAGTLRTS